MSATLKVMTTVNASYGAALTPNELAAKIADFESAASFDASVFAFFSDVEPRLQLAFIDEMGVDQAQVQSVAREFVKKSGFPLALAV